MCYKFTLFRKIVLNLFDYRSSLTLSHRVFTVPISLYTIWFMLRGYKMFCRHTSWQIIMPMRKKSRISLTTNEYELQCP